MNERRPIQFMRQRANLEMMKTLQKQHDPRMLADWLWGNSPLKNGQHAARFQDKLESKLVPLVLAQEIMGGLPVKIPPVAPERAVLLGLEVTTGRRVEVDVNTFNRHALIMGNSGFGKTTLLVRIIHVLVRQLRVQVIFQDHKGEGRRLLRIFGDEAIVFRPDQEPWNILEPFGPPNAYWWGFASELGRAFNLRPETWTELPGVLARIHHGLKPGEPYRSLKDFERILKHLAASQQRHKFDTAAGVVATLNHFLGRTAYIRKSPALDDRFRVIIYEHLGLPPRIHSFLTGVRLLRLQLKSTAEGIA